MSKKIIVGISGASGAIYGVRILHELKKINCEIHLVVTNAAKITLKQETSCTVEDLKKLCNVYYPDTNIGAQIASGSFLTDGMIIAPCSINTMSQISCGITNNLLSRAADVVIKERRKLVLMVRETPLHLGHLQNMVRLSEMGAIIAPPMPAFYMLPKTLDDLIDYSVGRILSLFNIKSNNITEWKGL